MSSIFISHLTGIINGTFLLPGSKSITNRLLILKAIYPQRITIINPSEADDSVIMTNALMVRQGTVDVKNAGTCLRFLTAYYASVPSDILLHGSARLHERPIGDLVEALRTLGADIDYIDKEGYAPLRIKGKTLTGNSVSIDGTLSSQHISALMLIAPSLPDGLTIKLKGEATSATYIQMTERLLFDLGIYSTISDHLIDIPPQLPRISEYLVESDWSAASYWYTIAALSKSCSIYLPALYNSYLQGDIVISNYMQRFGVNTSFDNGQVHLTKTEIVLSDAQYEMNNEPDLVPAMAVALAGLGVKVVFDQIAHLRIKESDRISALETELNNCGFETHSGDDFLEIIPTTIQYELVPQIQTHGDHRIAMAFATLALCFKKIEMHNPEVVEKSYPGFWDELKKAGFVIEEIA